MNETLSIHLPRGAVLALLTDRGWTTNRRGQHVSPDGDWCCWHPDEALTMALRVEAETL